MYDVLVAGVAVNDFVPSVDWYRRLFGRDPDVVAHDTEVMWRIADRGRVYVKEDSTRAGCSLLTLAVNDLASAVEVLESRGVDAGHIRPEGGAGWKAELTDPGGNTVALIQVVS